MNLSTNPVFRRIYRKNKEAANLISELHQRAIVNDLGSFAIWTVYKDTAYDDVFVWQLHQLIHDPDFVKAVDDAVKKPENWYVNQWNKAKAVTKKERGDNHTPSFDMSDTEKIFVPELQTKRWSEDLDRMEKELQKQIKNEDRKRGR
jgi:hypothetical protein